MRAPFFAVCAAFFFISTAAVSACAPAERNVAISAKFDSVSRTLEVTGRRSAEVRLDPSVTHLVFHQIDSIDADRTPDLIRYFSSAYYGSLGQINGDVVIYSRNLTPDRIVSDPSNQFAANLPLLAPVTDTDAGFTAVQWRIQQAGRMAGRPLCTFNTGAALMDGLQQEVCYVACSGQSIIAADLVPTTSRVVLLYADPINLPGVTFLRSEWHTTVEYQRDGQWYVADPTFGFAFVTKRGRRLNTEELIVELDEGRARALTFAVLHEGQAHIVPGDVFIREQPTLASLYYTRDKRPEYRPRANGRAA